MCFFCGISIICCTAGCSVSNGSEKETGYSKEQTSEEELDRISNEEEKSVEEKDADNKSNKKNVSENNSNISRNQEENNNIACNKTSMHTNHFAFSITHRIHFNILLLFRSITITLFLRNNFHLIFVLAYIIFCIIYVIFWF